MNCWSRQCRQGKKVSRIGLSGQGNRAWAALQRVLVRCCEKSVRLHAWQRVRWLMRPSSLGNPKGSISILPRKTQRTRLEKRCRRMESHCMRVVHILTCEQVLNQKSSFLNQTLPIFPCLDLHSHAHTVAFSYLAQIQDTEAKTPYATAIFARMRSINQASKSINQSIRYQRAAGVRRRLLLPASGCHERKGAAGRPARHRFAAAPGFARAALSAHRRTGR